MAEKEDKHKKQERQEGEVEYAKYDKARIIGARALQISQGAPMLIKLSDEELAKLHYNPIEIAKLEFEKGIIPLTVKKALPGKRE